MTCLKSVIFLIYDYDHHCPGEVPSRPSSWPTPTSCRKPLTGDQVPRRWLQQVRAAWGRSILVASHRRARLSALSIPRSRAGTYHNLFSPLFLYSPQPCGSLQLCFTVLPLPKNYTHCLWRHIRAPFLVTRYVPTNYCSVPTASTISRMTLRTRHRLNNAFKPSRTYIVWYLTAVLWLFSWKVSRFELSDSDETGMANFDYQHDFDTCYFSGLT